MPTATYHFNKIKPEFNYTFNNTCDSNRKAQPNSKFFDLLITDSVAALLEGSKVYVFTKEQINAIIIRLKDRLIITYTIEDELYLLKATKRRIA